MKTHALLLAPLLLIGCARDDTTYPSLAPRAAEKVGFAEPQVTAPAPAVADPALDARLAALGTRLDAIAKGYTADAARAGTAAKVAGARTVGSEAWIAAQSALATLDDWRAQAAEVATDVDEAGRERAASVGTAYPALDALHTRAEAEAAREAAGIATLGAKLPTS